MRGWNRKLWAVKFTSKNYPNEKPIMIGQFWHNNAFTEQYPGEPPRALLFKTRSQARNWCAEKNAEWENGSNITKKWHVSPVRVTETVK